jgi:CobQ-like glutamine amidotransferase family enzyme
MSGLRILHLYPRELGINGDAGNVSTLVRRLEWRGLEPEVVVRGIGEKMPTKVDLVHIGTGQAAAQRIVHPDLMTIASALRDLAAAGIPMLAITAGWQLFGRELELVDGTVLEGVGILPSRARLVNGRVIGEITGSAEDGGLVAGFENHGAVTTILDGASPVMTVTKGYGNACRDEVAGQRLEGVRDGGNVGTNLHGPFLPMNPRFADELLTTALARQGVELPEADERIKAVDELALKAREAIVGRVGR